MMDIAFTAFLLAGHTEDCLELLIKAERFMEACFFARTYLPSHVSRCVKLAGEDLVDPPQDPERIAIESSVKKGTSKPKVARSASPVRLEKQVDRPASPPKQKTEPAPRPASPVKADILKPVQPNPPSPKKVVEQTIQKTEPAVQAIAPKTGSPTQKIDRAKSPQPVPAASSAASAVSSVASSVASPVSNASRPISPIKQSTTPQHHSQPSSPSKTPSPAKKEEVKLQEYFTSKAPEVQGFDVDDDLDFEPAVEHLNDGHAAQGEYEIGDDELDELLS
jgi:coatomer subunit beta'